MRDLIAYCCNIYYLGYGSCIEWHNCYLGPSYSKWDAFVLQVRHSTTTKNAFSIPARFDIRNDLFSYRGPGIVQQAIFVTWRVPLHNDERKHNLISTVIYRTDCSNGVTTISSSPSPPLPPPLVLFLILTSVLPSPPIPALFIPWRMHSKPCKWEQVNKWMFHECFYDEKMQMRMSEWMNV